MASTKPSKVPSVLLGAVLGVLLTVVAQNSVFDQDSNLSNRILQEEDEPVVSRTHIETAIVCIIAFLIVVTIAFEDGKEKLEEAANHNMRPILASLFGELTILGFLSACTFLITQTQWPNHLSEQVFGEPHLLVELFEQVHFSVFFIMVSFVLQVLLLVRQSMQTERVWDKMDESPPTTAEGRLFHRLHKEFVLERSVEPPFEPSSARLPDDFRFGRYLSICLGRNMAHVVHVNMRSWFFFLLVTFLFYELMLVLHNDMMVLSWIWVGLGWLVFASTIVFERYIHGIMEAFAAPERDATPSSSNGVNEEDPLISPRWTQIPKWCHVNLEEYMTQRSALLKFMSPEEPNRQDSVFFMEQEGHELHFMFLQVVFVFLGIYIALFLITFLPGVWSDYTHNMPMLIGYIVLSALPVLLIQGRSRHLMAKASIVGCIGMQRRRPEVIADVLREDKTAKVVRAFIVLDRMRRTTHGSNGHDGSSTRSVSLEGAELAEVSKTFDALDHSGDGEISTSEMERLMYGMGQPLNEEKLQEMVAALDKNGDGMISKSEFLDWYKGKVIHSHHHDEHVTIHERAKALFHMFDRNGDGKISVGEFKTTLDSFAIGFTIDEVGLIVRELDEDGNVNIGLKEFEELLEKYYPRELESEE